MYFFFFYPVGFSPRPDRPAPGTLLLLAILVCIYALTYVRPELYVNLVHASFRADDPSLPRAALSLFLHGSWVHLASNGLYLLIFGRQLEARLGFPVLAGIFLVGGVAGCYTQAWLTPADAWNRSSAVIGASGAIAALLGACLLRFYHTRVRVLYFLFALIGGVSKGGVVHVNAVLAASFWLVFQVVHGLVAWGNGGSSTAYAAHAGGFFAGFLIAIVLGFPQQARLEVHREKGKRYFEKGDWYAAVGEFTTHLALVPTDEEVRAMRARCFVLLGRNSEATVEYQGAFRAAQRGGDWSAVAYLYREMRRYGIGTALNERTLMRLSFELQKFGEHEAAAEAYRELGNRFPDGPKAELALIRRAEVLWDKVGDVEAAVEGYRELLESYPESEWRDLAEARLRSMRMLTGDVPGTTSRS